MSFRASRLLAAVATLLAASQSYAVSVDFTAYSIRNGGQIVENVNGNGFTADTHVAGQKVGYGTSYFNGQKLNTFNAVNFTASLPGSSPIPYLNFWVTNGTQYAVIASEGEYRGGNLQTGGWKVFEYAPYGSNLSWLFGGATTTVGPSGNPYLFKNGVAATLADFANTVVLGGPAPGSGYGTGAPNPAFGFNIVYGDTLANYTTSPLVVGGLNLTAGGQTFEAGAVTPLPPAALGGVVLLGSRFFGRRRSAQA